VNGRQGLTAGVILILVGAYLLLQNVISWHGPGPVLLLLGAALFTASALRGFRGPLLPGSVLLCLGAAFLLERPLEPWLPRWSTILAVVASSAVGRAINPRALEPLARLWPWLLVAAGLFLIVRAARR
jgi:membrane-bound ClpP family serine protease